MELDAFAAALRSALMQLDDLQSLRHSPLLPLLKQRDQSPSALTLQQFLVDEIESLSRNAHIPSQFAEILYFRYVNQLDQPKVAYQLGLSVRQLRRLQNKAIAFLADHLWRQLRLDTSSGQATQNPALGNEVAWLREEFASEVGQADQELAHALHDAAPLSSHYAVELVRPNELLPSLVPVPPHLLRQAFLTLLTTTMAQAPGQRLHISQRVTETEVALRLRIGEGHEASFPEQWPGLETVKQLIDPFDGELILERGEKDGAMVVLRLPTVQSVPILVVEDNPDTQHLLQRYAAHSRYRLILTDDGHQAITLAQQHDVRVLVLDIMMYEMAGWDLLSEWRHHPATQVIPVVICTILPQEELSRLLGATAFLQKPVNQQRFLETLDALTGVRGRKRG
jgi:CheY-like chemotaxis protein